MTYGKEIIDVVIERFDFEKVRKYMLDVNWTWARCEGTPDDPILRTPTVDELKETARMILEEENTTGTGGFLAIKEKDYVELIFCLENKMVHITENEIALW